MNTTPGDTTTYAYVWQFNDGGPTTVATSSSQITHTFPQAGSYDVALAVTDTSNTNYGASRAVAMTVKAGNNQPPVAAFTAPSVLRTGKATPFSASVSHDPDGSIVTYDWSWGDNTASGSGVSPSHTFSTAGTYSVTLTVTDSSNATAHVVHQVTVRAPVGYRPTPRARITFSRPVLTYRNGFASLITHVTAIGSGRITQVVTTVATTRGGTQFSTRCQSTRIAAHTRNHPLICDLSRSARAALHQSARTLKVVTVFDPDHGRRVTDRQFVYLNRLR